jgi:hypothetical protein
MRSWRRVPSLISIFLLVAGAASGCRDRVFDFGYQITDPDAGGADAPVVDGPTDHHVTPDLTGFGGSGNSAGTGGRGGGSGTGGSSGGGSGGTGGSVPICSNSSPDRQTDISNCGTCFHSCLVKNSNPSCVAGVCKFSCFTDFFDADGDPTNGCECTKSNAGVEACDGFDNNCNGMVDEGFNFMTDVANCGGCNVTCSFPFAVSSCMNGMCKQGACLPGFYDRDPNVPGCETACEKSNGGVEICDGQDNDCDGVVDNNPMAGPLLCHSLGVCAGVQPTCMGQTGWVCQYPATYQDVEDTTKTCDGLDNDCDGRIDEPFQIGQACTVGSGACANPNGMWVCDNTVLPSRHRCNGSPKPPGTETCNGLDDDCDGKVDELDSASNRTTDDKLIYLSGPNVTMFAYEATRYDATASSYGFDSTRRPCSVPGRQPWSNVTKEEAEASCEKIGSGWRLCTSAEWLDACNSSGDTTFPYGATYAAQSCNGWDYTKAAGVTTVATGAATLCKSDPSPTVGDELYDMSGNVKEWVLTTTTTTGPFEMRGGAYNTASFTVGATTSAAGLQCDASIPAPTTAVRLPSVGYRCCRTGTLPP